MDEARKAFEAWARGPAGYVDDQLARYANGNYQDSATLLHWSIFSAGWKAAAQPQPAPDLKWVGPATQQHDAWVAENRKNGTALDTLAAWLEATKRAATQPQPVAPADDEAFNKNGLAWAVACWQAEVSRRPLVNVHRRTLDDTWRQVLRYFGGDPEKLIGPSHDTLLMREQEARAWKPPPPVSQQEGKRWRFDATKGDPETGDQGDLVPVGQQEGNDGLV